MYFSTRKAYEVWLATASESEKQSVTTLGLYSLTSAEGLVIPAGVKTLGLPVKFRAKLKKQ